MNNEIIKKLKHFTTGSFAIWPYDSNNLKTIHNRIIILGLNPSAKIKFGENFHRKRFDRWYEEGFSHPPFTGSYMTDLISQCEPISSKIIKKWKNNKFKEKNVESLKKQFEILGIKKQTHILCLGKNTERLFSSVLPEFKNVLSISHPNSYRMKNKKTIFLKDLKKIGKKIADHKE